MQFKQKGESHYSVSLWVTTVPSRDNSVSFFISLLFGQSTEFPLFFLSSAPVKPCCVSHTKQTFLSLLDQILGVLHHSDIPSEPDRTVQFLTSLGLIFFSPSPTRLGRQLPQMRENGVPQDSLNDYYLTYSVLPSLSDSFWPYRSTVIFSLEDVDVSYAREVTSEYFLVIELHLDAQVDSVCFVLLASGVLRFVIPVWKLCRQWFESESVVEF